MGPGWARVEVYAEPVGEGAPIRQGTGPGEETPGAINGYVCRVIVATCRSPAQFTPRVILAHPAAAALLEEHPILWYR